VDNLRQVRVAGQEATVPGQYVEPVQLQVVCFQMWENLGKGEEGKEGKEGQEAEEITLEDLAVAGDVDRALTQFYEETLVTALADSGAAGVSERQVRTWFDEELITEAGTRGLVHQGEGETEGLPNGVVKALQRRFLVRAEARGGDAWIELVHDRFVEPIRASNAAWFPQHLSPLQRQAALWNEQGRSDGLLLSGKALAEAEAWAAAQEAELESHERDFLKECKLARKQAERERKQKRLIGALAVVVGLVAVLALVLFFNAREQTQRPATCILLGATFCTNPEPFVTRCKKQLYTDAKCVCRCGVRMGVEYWIVDKTPSTGAHSNCGIQTALSCFGWRRFLHTSSITEPKVFRGAPPAVTYSFTMGSRWSYERLAIEMTAWTYTRLISR
jgi:hypothetical protein